MKQQIKTWKARPFSWSQLSSFAYSKEQWFSKYIEGHTSEPSPQMLFGNVIGAKLTKDPSFLPSVLRYKVFEQELRGKIGKLNLIGFIDSFNPKTKDFYEYKTSSNKGKWNRKSVQEHGQILFYKLLIWQNYKVVANASLFYIPAEMLATGKMRLSKDPVKSFETNHTLKDILNFGAFIKKTIVEMEEYVKVKKFYNPLKLSPARTCKPKEKIYNKEGSKKLKIIKKTNGTIKKQ